MKELVSTRRQNHFTTYREEICCDETSSSDTIEGIPQHPREPFGLYSLLSPVRMKGGISSLPKWRFGREEEFPGPALSEQNWQNPATRRNRSYSSNIPSYQAYRWSQLAPSKGQLVCVKVETALVKELAQSRFTFPLSSAEHLIPISGTV